jgi:hypothetical protein
MCHVRQTKLKPISGSTIPSTRPIVPSIGVSTLEQSVRLELTSSRWQREVLPLNYDCILSYARTVPSAISDIACLRIAMSKILLCENWLIKCSTH